MKINIQTINENCFVFLQGILPLENCIIDLRLIDHAVLENLGNYHYNNEYGWTFWVNIFSYSFLEKPEDEDYNYDSAEINTYDPFEFFKKVNKPSYKNLFELYYVYKGNELIVSSRNEHFKKLINLGVTPQSFAITTGFIYPYNEYDNPITAEDGSHVINEDYVKDAYEQIKHLFYSINKKLKLSIFISPPANPFVEDDLEAWRWTAFHDYDPDEEARENNGWEELGREEMRKMNDETNGSWRIENDLD